MQQTQPDDNRTISKPEGKPLSEYEGETVSVYCGEFPRSEGFPTGISVNGKLEYNPERNQYRVLVENGSYSYFTEDDVVQIRAGEDYEFKDGGKAVIFLDLEMSELNDL